MAVFDTLQYYEELKRAGLQDAAASAIAHGQLRFAEQNLVSRAHFDATIQHLEAKINSGLGSLKVEVRLLYLYITLAVLVFGTLAHFHIV